jgi:hypothetical protein
MQKMSHKKQTHHTVRGFGYLLRSAFSLCILFVLLTLPLAPAFASEDISTDGSVENIVPDVQPVLPSEVPAEVPAEPSIEVQSPEVVNTPPSQASTNASSTDVVQDITPVSSQIDTTAGTTTASTTDTSAPNEIQNQNDTSDSLSESTQQQSTTSIDQNTSTTDVVSSATSSVEQPSAPVSVNQSEVPASTTVVNTLTNDENRFSFAKNECVSTREGTFYCTKGSDTAVINHTDRFFAQIDVEGDKEIYLEKDSKITQVTFNHEDDDAPYYDEVSDILVWHRLIDGRYQIISHDIQSGEETQITHESNNNMEPHQYGDTTVWQCWIGNDWEICMDVHGERTVLTDNEVHDIAPSINGDTIVWQTFESNIWKMKVYDMRTKVSQTIEDTEGGLIENARFVLVYDAKLQTGDVETRGYDIASKKVISLGAKPLPVPEKIPDPDQTGEKRAMVTPPAQPKAKVEGENDTLDGPPPDDLNTSTGDLVIPALTTATSTATSTSLDLLENPSDALLVLPLATSTPSTSVEHIVDVVVAPYVEPSSEVLNTVQN